MKEIQSYPEEKVRAAFQFGQGSTLVQRLLYRTLEAVLGLKDLSDFYTGLPGRGLSQNPQGALQGLGVQWRVRPEDLRRIPEKGPLVVVANHPYGGVEGLILLELLKSRRPDVRLMANSLLGRVPGFDEKDFIWVDPFGRKDSPLANRSPLREAVRWVRGGGVLALFPAGEVAHQAPGRKEAVDPLWSPTLGRLLRLASAPVVPVFFPGSNGPLFHWAGRLHPRFRTALLVRELLNKRGRKIQVEVGSAVPAERCVEFPDEKEMTEHLRFRTYLLKGRGEGPKLSLPILRFPGKSVASAIPVNLIEEEMERLGEGRVLAANGELEVRWGMASELPAVIREVGRLREITFRACGEGTGKPLDLDAFDHRYLHLVLWNRSAREIVGGYRLAQAPEIIKQFGSQGLYTSTLFQFQPDFWNALSPSLELGRSFIRPEYQREFAPLFLLWKALGAFVAVHPQYRFLFGVVSMSDEYKALSKDLLIGHLRRRYFREDLAQWAKPRNPYRALHSNPEWDTRAWDKDIDEVSSWIAQVERGREVPVLLRQYLKLGAEFMGFNVVDLVKTAPRALDRYLGKEGALTFRKTHGMEAPVSLRSVDLEKV